MGPGRPRVDRTVKFNAFVLEAINGANYIGDSFPPVSSFTGCCALSSAIAMAAQLFRRSFWYWDRRSDGRNDDEEADEEEEGDALRPRAGIVVILGWMLSRRKNLAPYTRLYKSCGWDCLVCHPQVFNLFSPGRATTLALSVLDELAKDLETHPCPVVFALFSGGPKACLYKIIQILLGNCTEVSIDEGRFEVVVRSLAGLMFDSSPVDFVSHLGAKFVSHQVLTFQPGRPIAIISCGAYALGRGIDVIFSRQLGPQRIDLWQALYSSVKIGPILFLCSENDELAPVETIRMFASNLRNLGGKVDMVVWKESEHVGHFRLYPEQYSSEVRKLLTNAASMYSERLEKSAKYTAASCIGNIGGVGDFGVSFDTSSMTWTDLPESISSEIIRVSRLPHVQVKRGGKGERESPTSPVGSVYHGVELQACSMALDVLDGRSLASQRLGIRSRL